MYFHAFVQLFRILLTRPTEGAATSNKAASSSSSSSSESRWLSPQLPHEKYPYAPHAPHCMLHIADLHFHSCQKYNKFTDILFLSTELQFQVLLKSWKDWGIMACNWYFCRCVVNASRTNLWKRCAHTIQLQKKDDIEWRPADLVEHFLSTSKHPQIDMHSHLNI